MSDDLTLATIRAGIGRGGFQDVADYWTQQALASLPADADRRKKKRAVRKAVEAAKKRYFGG